MNTIDIFSLLQLLLILWIVVSLYACICEKEFSTTEKLACALFIVLMPVLGIVVYYTYAMRKQRKRLEKKVSGLKVKNLSTE